MKASDPSAPPAAIGILGGTFDPVHRAHLALARVAADTLGLAQVLWIPAGQPPHRPAPHAAPPHRLAMVQAAIADDTRFVIDPSEVASSAASYTVHTLERLRQQFGPQRPLVLLMGADAFHGFARWHRWQEIFDLAHLGVATRPGFPLEGFEEPLAAEFARRCGDFGQNPVRRPANADFSAPAGSIRPFELVAGTVSATEVRSKLAAGADTDTDTATLLALLPGPVLDYIRQHHLYTT